MGRHKRNGFTIVELLIVIVVIGILAAITIVAFNGVQQRAKNSAKISTVESLVKLISLARVEYGTFPIGSNGAWCLTSDNLCTDYDGSHVTSSNTALMSAIGSYGNPPASTSDNTSGTYYGIEYKYTGTRTLSGASNPVLLVFWLDGTNQTCTNIVSGMVSVSDGGGGNMVPSAQSKADTGTGQTRCYLMFSS